MINLKKLILPAALAAACALPAGAELVKLNSPADCQVFGISPNGEWAVGMMGTGDTALYAFRWNLLTNDFDLSPAESYCGTTISNDGVYCGGFLYTNAVGRQRTVPGYYDGKWHQLSIPGVDVTDAYDGCISPDGRYMAMTVTGATPYSDAAVWKDGEFQYFLQRGDGTDVRVYTMTPDGQHFGGWVDTKNRQSAFWNGGGEPNFIDKYYAPWAEVTKFTPNGEHFLWDGGWTYQFDADGNMIQYGEKTATEYAIWGVYDMATGEKHKIFSEQQTPSDHKFFDINDSLTMVGSTGGGMAPIIVKDFQCYYLADYLKQNYGIDFNDYSEIARIQVDPSDTTASDQGLVNGSLALTYGYAISNDNSTYAVGYYGIDGYPHTMMLRTGVTFDQPAPVGLKAEQLDGVRAVRVSWTLPYGADDKAVKGYNIYRDGAKLNAEPIAECEYFDADIPEGEHTYTVTAIYESGETQQGTSAQSTATIDVTEPQPQAPTGIFCRQRGYTGAIMEWEAPRTNLVCKQYYDEESATEGAGTTEIDMTMETGTRFDVKELGVYSGAKISAVTFYPMSAQKNFTLTIYKVNDDNSITALTSKRLNTKELVIGKKNTITLDQALDIPASDIIVGIKATVVDDAEKLNVFGMQNGACKAGYTDLIRRDMQPEEEFSSMYNQGAALGIIALTTWKTALVLTPADASADIDEVARYEIEVNGSKVGDTAERRFIIPTLEEGESQVGIAAVYADGRRSPAATFPQTTTPDNSLCPPVDPSTIRVTLGDNPEGTGYDVQWEAPRDYDTRSLKNHTGVWDKNTEVTAPSPYNYTAGVKYTSKQLRSYGGYTVRSISFFPTCDADFTIQISKDGKQFVDQEVDSYELQKWNTVMLDEPFTIDEAASYLFAIDCYDVGTPSATDFKYSPLAVDKSLHSGAATDQILYDKKWETLDEVLGTQTPRHWLINVDVTAPEFSPVEAGEYNFFLDGAKTNSGVLHERRFTSETRPEGVHTVRVDARFGGKKLVKGTETSVDFSALSGIDGVQAEAAQALQVINGTVTAPAGYTAVTLYSYDGRTLAAGHSVDVSALAPGAYIVRATATGRTPLTRTYFAK